MEENEAFCILMWAEGVVFLLSKATEADDLKDFVIVATGVFLISGLVDEIVKPLRQRLKNRAKQSKIPEDTGEIDTTLDAAIVRVKLWMIGLGTAFLLYLLFISAFDTRNITHLEVFILGVLNPPLFFFLIYKIIILPCEKQIQDLQDIEMGKVGKTLEMQTNNLDA